MKNLLKVVLVLLVSIFIIGCSKTNNTKTQEPKETEETKEQTAEEKARITELLNKALESLNIPKETSSNLSLLSELKVEDLEATLVWSSSNKEVIEDNGTIHQKGVDENVTLEVKATIQGKEITLSKTFSVKVLKVNIDTDLVFNELKKHLNPEESIKFKLPNSIKVEGIDFNIQYTYDSEFVSSEGVITLQEEKEESVTVKASFNYNGDIFEEEIGTVTIPSMKTLCDRYVSENIDIPEIINSDIDLPTGDDIVTVEWTSSVPRILNNGGLVRYVSEDAAVKLTATVFVEYGKDTYFADDLEYNVTVTRWDPQRRYDLVIGNVTVPEETSYNISLIYALEYDVLCKWESSDPSIITNDGKITRTNVDQEAVLTLTLYCTDSTKTMTKEFPVKVLLTNLGPNEVETSEHNILDFAKDFNTSNFNGLVLENDKVVLASGALTGTYESKIFYPSVEFYEIVGSYSCVTTSNATCEVSYSLRVGETWSKYFSYGVWGLGKSNGYSDTSDSLAKISTDEIMVTNGKTANAVKYKFTLKRDKTTTDSPVMSMVAMAIFSNDYNITIDTSSLPDQFDWDVPKLYQHDVPSIGGSICSPTTTTMLLLWKGININSMIQGTSYKYPHEYIARMANDSGHNIFGNWSYNMICAGSFGVDAYVSKMYSWDELRYELVHTGPIGVSIKGYFGSYTTNGHLLVVRGYKINNGVTTVICNDPNVRGTYYEVSLDTFMGAWRLVSYVIL